jgi:hypothetical protein
LSDTEALSADLYHYLEEITCKTFRPADASKEQIAKSGKMIEEFVKQNLRSCGSSTITPPG